MRAIYDILFAWIPSTALRVIFVGLFALALIFIVLRLVKLVLDALPFV